MRGSLREKRPGYWQLRVSLGRDSSTGQPIYRTRSMRGTKREAQRALAALVTEVSEGRSASSAISVGDLLDQWLDHIEHEGRSPTTMRSYRSLRKQLPTSFSKLPLKKVSPRTIDDLYRQLGRKKGRGPSTVHHYHRLLRAAFNQAMRWELMDRNPAKLATPPKVRSDEVEPPEAEAVRRVLDQAGQSEDPSWALRFRLMAATGCRRSELCGLRWSDIDLNTGKVTFRRSVVEVGSELFEKDTKAHQQRTVTLDPGTIEALAAHRGAVEELAGWSKIDFNPAGFAFSDEPDGSRPIPPVRVSRTWRRLADRAGVDARLHDLRHLQASLLLDAGESVTTVAARLGHRDTATTLRVYSHLMPGADKRAAEIVGQMFEGEAAPRSDVPHFS